MPGVGPQLKQRLAIAGFVSAGDIGTGSSNVPGMGLILGACCEAYGQPAFEVASIRVQPGPVGSIGITTSGTRLKAEAETLLGLIIYAYHVGNYQVDRTPPLLSLGNTMYDVAAKAEGDEVPTENVFRQMVQTLLADRFKLKVHREMREMPVYALVVGKNGPRFKESAADADSQSHFSATGSNYQYYQATMPKATMADLAASLGGNVADRPVLDKTELTGTYDIRLTYTPQFKMSRGQDADPGEISIFTAVQEQLGLRLEAQKAMVEVLVVDHVEKPSEN